MKKQVPEALKYFLKGIEVQDQLKSYQTTIFHDFGRFVADNGLEDYYDLALEKNEKADVAFPLSKFYYYYIRSIIFHKKNNQQTAKIEAKNALDISQAKKSGFAFHQNLGLVNEHQLAYVERLKKIVSA